MGAAANQCLQRVRGKGVEDVLDLRPSQRRACSLKLEYKAEGVDARVHILSAPLGLVSLLDRVIRNVVPCTFGRPVRDGLDGEELLGTV